VLTQFIFKGIVIIVNMIGSLKKHREVSDTIRLLSLIVDGNRFYNRGSGIDSDSSMIAANDRWHYKIYAYSYCRRYYQNFQPELLRISLNNISYRNNPYLYSPRNACIMSLFPILFNSKYTTIASGNLSKSGMDDEYGEMTNDGYTYAYSKPLLLESGEILNNVQLRYMTYGILNETRDNVLVICHALTGNANLHSWWGYLLGSGKAFDTDKYFVVCANILGSCYGSTGPSSPIREYDGRTYGMDFPDVSVRDTVKLQLHMLRDELHIRSVKCVIGGSFGGMQAVEYAVQAGVVTSSSPVDTKSGREIPFVRSIVPIACGASHTAWQIAISELQRQAVYADPKWRNGHPDSTDPPLDGLSVARQIGMVSYRTPRGYDKKFGRKIQDKTFENMNNIKLSYGRNAQWAVKCYLQYQGWKFISRFDPVTYIKLTEQMDSHDVGRNRNGNKAALSVVKIPVMVLGIDSDILYPLHMQEDLARLFPNGYLRIIHSDAGHDGFLLEQEQVSAHIEDFLKVQES